MNKKNIDFAIIGGGASGIIASIVFKRNNPKKESAYLRKILN